MSFNSYDERNRSIAYGNSDTPFNHHIRSFLNLSSKSQSVYADCEGLCRKNFDTINEISFLKQYIYNNLYYKEDCSFLYELDKEKLEDLKRFFGLQNVNYSHNIKEDQLTHIEEICKKITSLGKKFSGGHEIYLSTIWVYYYDHEKKQKKTIPVFKLYKSKKGNEGVFMDVNLKLYESWSSFLGTVELPKSLLCVPRHGEYSYVRKQLDLEFICHESLTLGSYTKFDEYKLKPFSQVVIQPWLEKTCSCSIWLKEKITQMTEWVLNKLEQYGISLQTAIIFSLVAAVQLHTDWITSNAPITHKIKDLLLMTADIKCQINDVQLFMSKMVKSKVGTDLLIEPGYPDLKELLNEITHLSKDFRKNWPKIFEKIFTVFRKFQPVLRIIEYLIISFFKKETDFVPHIFRLVHFFLQIDFIKSSNSEGTMPLSPTIAEAQCAGISSIQDDMSICEYHPKINSEIVGANNLESLSEGLLSSVQDDMSICEYRPKINSEIVRAINSERLSEGLRSLFEEYLEYLSTVPDIQGPILLDIVKNFAIIYIPGISLPKFNEYCLRYLGPKVSIHVIDKYTSLIKSDSGEEVGVVALINDSTAIAAVHVERVKNADIKILKNVRRNPHDVVITGDRNTFP